MPFNRLRCFSLIVTCFFLAGCSEKKKLPPPPVTVNFVSADPPNGSTIKPDATITVTFDDFPGPVAVTQGTATMAGRTVSISGPFSAGSLSLNISWADGVQRLTYTVDDPTSEGMVPIPAGEFQMGSNDPEAENDEQPVHTVYVDAFFMDKYEVTNLEYQKFVLANPRWSKGRIADRYHDGYYLQRWNGNDYPSGYAKHPVVYVSWYAAMAYAGWAEKRLPTEAEWEYAARGGLDGQKYPWGDVIDSGRANYYSNVGDTTAVDKYPPNGYGLYDMAAMCGSGVWMSTIRISIVLLPVRIRYRGRIPLIGLSVISQVLKKGACCAAVRGTMIRNTCGLLLASGTIQRSLTSTSGFVV